MVCARRIEDSRLAHMRARNVVGREEPEKKMMKETIGSLEPEHWKHCHGEVNPRTIRRYKLRGSLKADEKRMEIIMRRVAEKVHSETASKHCCPMSRLSLLTVEDASGNVSRAGPYVYRLWSCDCDFIGASRACACYCVYLYFIPYMPARSIIDHHST